MKRTLIILFCLVIGVGTDCHAKKKKAKNKSQETYHLEVLPQLGPLEGEWQKFQSDIKLVINAPYNRAYFSKMVSIFKEKGVNEESLLLSTNGRGGPSAYKGPKLAVPPKFAKFLYAFSGIAQKKSLAAADKYVEKHSSQKTETEKALEKRRMHVEKFSMKYWLEAVKAEKNILLQCFVNSSFRSNPKRDTGIIYVTSEESLTKSVKEFEEHMADMYQEEIEETTSKQSQGLNPAGVTGLSVQYILGESDSANWRKISANKKSGYVVTKIAEKAVFKGGSLKVGDVLIGLNNKKFEEKDYWGKHFGQNLIFGNAIERAEATGRLILNIKRPSTSSEPPYETLENGKEYKVMMLVKKTIPFSKTMPYNCKKSDVIASLICEFLANKFENPSKSVGYYDCMGLLALLSAGNDRYDQIVKKITPRLFPNSNKCETGGMCTWKHTSKAFVLCEYYLRTKDKSVLPAINNLYKILADGQLAYYGSGHGCGGGDYRGSGFSITAAHTVLAFGLMKKCGIKMDMDRVKKSLQFLLSATNRGTLEYGALRTVKKNEGKLDYRYDGSNKGSGARNGVAALAARLLGNLKEAPDYSAQLINGLVDKKGEPESRHAQLANTHGCKIMGLLWGGCAVASDNKANFSEVMKKHIWHLQLARLPGEGWLKEHPQANFSSKKGSKVKPSTLWNATYALLLNAKKQNLYITGKAWKKNSTKKK